MPEARLIVVHLVNGGCMRINQFSNNTLRSRESSMSHYFFHLKRGQVTVLDQVGIELADVKEAAREATRRGRDIAAQDAAQGIAARAGAIVVANQHWSPIFEVPMEGDDV
jgi:hypothetical protein